MGKRALWIIVLILILVGVVLLVLRKVSNTEDDAKQDVVNSEDVVAAPTTAQDPLLDDVDYVVVGERQEITVEGQPIQLAPDTF